MSRPRAASESSVVIQPTDWMAVSAAGSMTNWPSEPTDMATPMAKLRRPGGVLRRTAPKTTGDAGAGEADPDEEAGGEGEQGPAPGEGHEDQAGDVEDGCRRRSPGRRRTGRRSGPRRAGPRPRPGSAARWRRRRPRGSSRAPATWARGRGRRCGGCRARWRGGPPRPRGSPRVCASRAGRGCPWAGIYPRRAVGANRFHAGDAGGR